MLNYMARADYYKEDGRMAVRLRFGADNKFKIMQLTDLHMGEDEELNQKTVDLIENMIGKERPDFIAITGDLVSGQKYNTSHNKDQQWWWRNQFLPVANLLREK